ncbi:NUDIX hydrolase [Candidatus Woesearchaeota archaeon ex4484_78]|nr:MAG: NUDIX hydrolase [Candidatus Woesearchaeota archaeon ex4484_78]
MESKATNYTLVYLIRDNLVLLIEKKRGLGKGFMNGVGGKVEFNERIEDAARREVFEEVKVRVDSLEKRGVILFTNKSENLEFLLVHVFVSKDFDGEPEETDEAKPVWYNINKMPFDKMWVDDKYWLPLVINGEFVYGEFYFENWKLKDYFLIHD